MTDDLCELCDMHERAHDTLPDDVFPCPGCGEMLEWACALDAEMTVVGARGHDDDPEALRKLPMIRCHCGQHVALFPDRVIWNANHDVYYTGADHFIDDAIPYWDDAANKSIENFVKRVRAGEDLKPWMLKTWLTYRLNEAIARYLHSKGMKR